MSDKYIPDADSAALAWMKTFAAGLVAGPWRYTVSAAEAATIQSAVDAFDAAFSQAKDPARRTPVAVAIKCACRNAAEQLCRQYASLIKHNAGISDADKVAIGVRPVNPTRERINCPQTAPALNVMAATFGTHVLTYTNSGTVDSGAKPYGATELQLFIAIADAPVRDPEQARFYNKFTRNPVSIRFVSANDRKKATYFARWANRHGEVSPWSEPVSMSIAA
jgi:hypothetical protein